MLDLSAPAAIAISVAMHVAWNLLARQQPKDSYPIWWVLAGHIVVLGPWGLFHFLSDVDWTPHFVLLLIVSAIALAAYFIALDRAYRHAPVTLVYPLVRSSPLLIAAWSTVLFSESLGTAVWLGICVNVSGLLLMAGTGRRGEDARAIPWALLAMFGTSVYSISDNAALAALTGMGSIVGFITIGYFVSWIALSISLRARIGRWTPPVRMGVPTIVGGGVCVGMSYALIIHAMRSLPAAEAVAYSNAGIVVASLISIFMLGENYRWKTRLTGGFIICAGLIIMAFGKA